MNAVFEFIRNIFAIPFGYVLGFFYDFTGSYLVAIILLTLLVKLCFLPFSINQQKGLVEQAKQNAAIKKIKKQYADDPEKIKEEIEALKANNKDKKKNLGCLPSIVQIIVLIGLFGVIYSPLTSVLQIKDSTIDGMKTVMSEVININEDTSSMTEITLLKETENYKDVLLSEGVLTEQNLNDITTFSEKYTFWGIDLSKSPELAQLNALWLIPLLVLIIGILSRLYSLLKRKKYNPGKGKFTALDAFPFISLMIMFLFTFTFPAGVGLYWAISNLLSFIEEAILGTIYNPYKFLLEERNNNNEYVVNEKTV